MEDAPTRSPLGSPNKGGLVSVLGTLPREDGSPPISGAIPGVPAGLIMPDPGLAEELVAIVGPPSHEVDWQKPIAEYLQVGAILDDEIETWCLACRVKGYLIHDNGLYQCGTVGILQWCIPPKEAKALLFDIHEGIYGHHTSSWSMVGKAFQQGFYCPTVASDAAQIVRSCWGCQ
jgi:hypothetical protein